MSFHLWISCLLYSYGERNVPFSAMHGGKLDSSIFVFDGSRVGSFSWSTSFRILQKELSKTLPHVVPFHLLSCHGTRAERCLTGRTLNSPFAFTFLRVTRSSKISPFMLYGKGAETLPRAQSSMGGPVSFRLSFLLRHVLTVFCISIPSSLWAVVDTGLGVNPHRYTGVGGANIGFTGIHFCIGLAGTWVYTATA